VPTEDLDEATEALYLMFSEAAGHRDLPEPWWSDLKRAFARVNDHDREQLADAAWRIQSLAEAGQEIREKEGR
jgi:hypothetical protein